MFYSSARDKHVNHLITGVNRIVEISGQGGTYESSAPPTAARVNNGGKNAGGEVWYDISDFTLDLIKCGNVNHSNVNHILANLPILH